MNYIRQVNELHEKAMEFADLAFIAKRRKQADAIDLFRQAFEYENEAAQLVIANKPSEPTRSVLLRSAASLALNSGEIREAEKLVALALTGEPPEEIADELRDLLEQIHFQRHLRLQGIELEKGELQLSVVGNEIGYGIALSDIVLQRISKIEKLIHRTVDRLRNQQYREQSSPSKLAKPYNLYLSAPRAGSFSLTLRVGRFDQPMLPVFDDSDEIIDEVLENLDLVNNEQYEVLRQKIPDAAYYRNFVGLAKSVAPDGDKVSFVGLTTVRNGVERSIGLTKLQNEIPVVPKVEPENKPAEELGEATPITGTLRYANSIESNQVRLIDAQGNPWTVIVPEGLMNDVVKPFWDEVVTVVGFRVKGKKRKINLQDIKLAD